MAKNPFASLEKTLAVDGVDYKYFDFTELKDQRIARLPFTVRVLLESAVRNCDAFQITEADIEKILSWEQNAGKVEVPFKPARVLMQDFTGVPAVVDLAAMRDAMARLGGDPAKINPLCPVDLVIDHSVQVDYSGSPEALELNQAKEYERNAERFTFLKWGSKAFDGLTIVPPGTGIVHQVNLEYLARVVFQKDKVLYPDSLVGTDSHTTMINGLGVLGWGVGGIEAESAMLGTPMSFLLPPVVGFKLTGKPQSSVTSTDVVLTAVAMLRKHGVVGKFVEFYGPGVKSLSIADRATIANMAPEYGATCGFFPVDTKTLEYLRVTGREEAKINYIQKYMEASGQFNEGGAEDSIVYTEHMSLDLSTVEACVAGPKRPQDHVTLRQLKGDFAKCLNAEDSGFKGFGQAPANRDKVAKLTYQGQTYDFPHGTIVIAAITSCTNTSNPNVMLQAGMVARKAVALGLSVKPFVKTSLSPGSGVASRYLEDSGLQEDLNKLGFDVTGFGCMTCIGNSGELKEGVSEVIKAEGMVACSILSGNRNFEARVHQDTAGNYLASPPLVVAAAIAGTANIDFATEPIGKNKEGKDVFLSDIWPTNDEVQEVVNQFVLPKMFQETYSTVTLGNARWNALNAPTDPVTYPWPKSTYINNPPFFQKMQPQPDSQIIIKDAFCLLYLGDSVTTDHISPAGKISTNSPAAQFLISQGVESKDFNTYGARRGNDLVMARGTFANTRLSNKIVGAGNTGPVTIHHPSGEKMAIFDAAARYQEEGFQTVVLAGKEYGSGSSRDWAAKGPYLQGIKAVIAESFERIHRSNLVGMGVIPLTFKAGQTAASLGLTGMEKFTIDIPANPSPQQDITVTTSTGLTFTAMLRIDTNAEVVFWKNGGLLQYVLRTMLGTQ